MDPITLAIVTALAAGVAGGVAKVGEAAIVDGYAALKDILKRKFGPESEVVKAVKGLEDRPDSPGRKSTLQEEVGAAKADQDEDVRAAAQALLDRLQTHPEGARHIMSAVGSNIAQADRGATASVTVNDPKA